MVITSSTNQYVESAKKLLTKKYRYQMREYLIEGEKLLKDAIRFGADIRLVFVEESYLVKYELLLNDVNAEILVVSKKVIDCLSDTVTPQGVVCIIGMQNYEKPTSGKGIFLDNLQDPANLGALLRTCLATDYKEIYLYKCVDVYSAKCVRSAMSAQFALNFHFIDNYSEIENGTQLICADMNGENVFKASVNVNHILVLGNEGNGVSAELKKMCNKTVMLPMKNNLESLNVAVSGSIIMYALTTKLED